VTRRFLIRIFLPTLLCIFPIVLAVVVCWAIPPLARRFYLDQIVRSKIDWLILTSGVFLFLWQINLSLRGLRWQETGFNEAVDSRLSTLAQAGEWFPLLGLIGTVAGILQTFGSISGPVTPNEIIEKYSPAITATGSGLLMALLNILPIWIVQFGREMIRHLGALGQVKPRGMSG
jgi:hypothetical protein